MVKEGMELNYVKIKINEAVKLDFKIFYWIWSGDKWVMKLKILPTHLRDKKIMTCWPSSNFSVTPLATHKSHLSNSCNKDHNNNNVKRISNGMSDELNAVNLIKN